MSSCGSDAGEVSRFLWTNGSTEKKISDTLKAYNCRIHFNPSNNGFYRREDRDVPLYMCIYNMGS